MYHPTLDFAVTFANIAHKHQQRKYTGRPYIEHCLAVMAKVETVPHTVEQLAASVLHDVVEDTHVQIREIEYKFGPTIGSYVGWLTKASIVKDADGKPSNIPGLNRRARMLMDLTKLIQAPREVMTIKLADIIDNGKDLLALDPEFAKVWMPEKRLALSVLTRGDSTLWQEADGIIRRYQPDEPTRTRESASSEST